MDIHDEPLGESRPDRAETEKLLRGIGLAAVPQDRDSFLWACGYEAGKAATGGVTPKAGAMIRAWFPLVASTAAAFFIGFVSAGPSSRFGTLRDANPDVAASAPRVPKPTTEKPARPAPAFGRFEKPRDGLYASVPPHRLESLFAAPHVQGNPGAVVPPLDDPPLRVRNSREALSQFSL